jgi:DNA-binding transcriptional LysR family regulator
MNILGIEAFLKIMETKSISKAAEMLHLSQSTVSHRLESLERELGATLIYRNKGSKSITLTTEGEEFISIAERWLYLLEETLQYQKSNKHRSLTLAGVDSLNTYIFPPLFQQLIEHTPALNLRVRTHQSMEIYDLLEKHEIDAGFVLREVYRKNIIVEPLFREKMILIRLSCESDSEKSTGPNEIDANYGRLIHPSELDPKYEFFFDWGYDFNTWHNFWWGSLKYPRFWSDTASMMQPLMKDPLNWAIVPISLAKSFQKTGNYKLFNIMESPPDRICYKITHQNPTTRSKEVQKILNKYLSTFITKFK